MLTHRLIAYGTHGLIATSIEIALVIICAWSAPSVIYCMAMLAAASAQKRGIVRNPARPRSIDDSGRTRFHVLIPAHDEALVISSALTRLVAVDYPASHVRYTVVADNCSDDTAELARDVPGVVVMERTDLKDRGKGYALNWAIERILADGDADAVVVVDADTFVDPGFLSAMDRAIALCSPDERERFVAQGLYKVLNVEDNSRTALMSGALSLVHFVRPMARERWRTSVGLKGNGMCFAREVLLAHKWSGASVTEDLDYGIELIEKQGIRVRFVPDAIVEAQMPTDPNAATTQRLRWEGGRKETIRNRSLSLLIGGIANCDRLRLDAAFDLMCPPLAQQASGLFIWAALVAWAAIIRAPGWMNWFVLWALSACGFVLYVIGGFKVADAPRAAYTALLTAPAFIPWKIAALVRGNRPNGWHRTDRKSMETSKKTDTGPANEAP